MNDETIVDYITMRAVGVAEVEKQIERLEKTTTKATTAAIALAKVHAEAKPSRSLVGLERAKQAADALTRQTQLQIRLESTKDGWYAKQLSHGKSLLAQRMAVEQAERKIQLQMKLGQRLGGGAFAVERAMDSTAGKLATGAGTGLLGAAMAGFSGTVEMNRLGTEVKNVSRELAGALMPAIELATSGAKVASGALAKLGPVGQNVLMTLLLLAGGRFAFSRLGGAGLLAGPAMNMGLLAGGKASAIPAMMAAGRYAAPLAVASTVVAATQTDSFDRVHKAAYEGGSNNFKSNLYGIALATGYNVEHLFSPVSANARLEKHVASFGPKKREMPERDLPKPGDASFDAVGTAYERIANTAAMNYAQDKRTDVNDGLIKALDANTAALKAKGGNGESSGKPFEQLVSDEIERTRVRGR